MLANRILETLQRFLEHFSHRMDLASILGLQEISSLDLTISIDKGLISSAGHPTTEFLLVFFPGFTFIHFFLSLSEMNIPACTLSLLYPWGMPFNSFVFHVHTFTTGGDDHPSAHCNEP